MNRAEIDPASVEIVPETFFAHLPLADLFRRAVPLEIDVGSGPGAFILAMAQHFPTHDFLGLERLVGRVRKTCRAASRLGLDNVRVLRVESNYAVRFLIPPASVRVFHVAFPDPWPKRRHWPRRLVNEEFLDALALALETGGELRVQTDDAPYFAHMRALFMKCRDLRQLEWPEDPHYPQTNFERRFRARGMPIYRTRLVKT